MALATTSVFSWLTPTDLEMTLSYTDVSGFGSLTLTNELINISLSGSGDNGLASGLLLMQPTGASQLSELEVTAVATYDNDALLFAMSSDFTYDDVVGALFWCGPVQLWVSSRSRASMI
jgi:hypothetical protein